MVSIYKTSPFLKTGNAYSTGASRPAAKVISSPTFGSDDKHNEAAEPETVKPAPKTNLLKRLILGLGLITAAVVFGKTILKKIGGKGLAAINLTALIAAGSKLLQSIGPKPLFGILSKISESVPKVQEFLTSASGRTLLTFAKSEIACKAIATGTLGIGSHVLPDGAFQLLKQHITHDNVKQLLEPEILSNLFGYMERLYQAAGSKGPDAFENYLSRNASRIGDNIAKITGLKPETVSQFLQALKPA
ncbi:MAG: hypothetical protein K0Q50_606 [Vampirovibrio sp.]|jgi:hypothetical protein|nr:hypothetical protein [Vampirovibrio sp.]